MEGATLSAVKLTLQARQLRERLGDAGLLQSEPIAIVGLACRFPGGRHRRLGSGICCARRRRDHRGAAAIAGTSTRCSTRTPTAPGKMSTRWGGFLERHRPLRPAVLRHLAARSGEHGSAAAAAARGRLGGARGRRASRRHASPAATTGVFVGHLRRTTTSRLLSRATRDDRRLHRDWARRCSIAGRPPVVPARSARARASPSTPRCSSSLVAVHLAVPEPARRANADAGARRRREPDALARADDVTLASAGSWRPTGAARRSTPRADGYVRGEGCGVVVLKRLSRRARRRRPRCCAVIRGSAVNQDGRSNGLTAPNGPAQQAVMRAGAAPTRGVAPSRVGYVEAHGTGTPLGDPIEVEALAEVLGGAGRRHAAAASARSKTNIGHLEAAAGIAGLIKAVLALAARARSRRTCIFRRPTRTSRSTAPAFEIPVEARAVAGRAPERRFAGVSSFGFGGTNAHVILEEAPQLPAGPAVPPPALLLPLSARSQEALAALAGWYAACLRDANAPAVKDVCFTASTRRTHHEYRLAAVGTSATALAEALESFFAGQARWDVSHGRRPVRNQPGPVFVFSGQGPQWWAMGRELSASDSLFGKALDAVAAAMDPVSGWSLLDVLGAEEAASKLGETEFAQPAIFALQVALAEALRARGVEPAAVVGHSVGEIAAACVAGALGLEEAVRVVVHRGRVMQRATGLGRMAAVAMDEARARALVAESADRLSLAAINAPRSVVLSGEGGAVAEAVARLEREGVACRMLPVNYAFHSYQMTALAGALRDGLGAATPRAAAVTILSTVTAQPVDARSFDAEYRVRNLTQPVRFSAALGWLARNGYDTFVEIAPHPVLTASIEETLAALAVEGTVVTTLRRGRPELSSLLAAIGRLFVTGQPVDWTRVAPRGRVVSLPAYAWQRSRYWFEAPATSVKVESPASPSTSLAVTRVRSPGIQDAVFESLVSAANPAFLADHCIQGSILMPATGLLSMTHAAARQVYAGTALALVDVAFEQPLVLGDDPKRIQVVLTRGPLPAGFRIVSLEDEEADRWTTHAVGRVAADSVPPLVWSDRVRGESALHRQRTGHDLYADFGSIKTFPLRFTFVISETIKPGCSRSRN